MRADRRQAVGARHFTLEKRRNTFGDRVTLDIDLPTQAEIAKHVSYRGRPAVSLCLGATPVTLDARADRIALQTMPKTGLTQVEESGSAKQDIESIRDGVKELIDDEFWTRQAHSPAIFVAPAARISPRWSSHAMRAAAARASPRRPKDGLLIADFIRVRLRATFSFSASWRAVVNDVNIWVRTVGSEAPTGRGEMTGKGLFGGLAVCVIAGMPIAGANAEERSVLRWMVPDGVAPWTDDARAPIPSDLVNAAPFVFGAESVALTADEDPFLRAVADVGPKDNEDPRDNETPVPEIPVWAMLLLGFLVAGLGFRVRPKRAPRLRTDGDF